MLSFRSGAHVARAEGELVYHALGTGEYEELTCVCPSCSLTQFA